jgi:hypothetical protein
MNNRVHQLLLAVLGATLVTSAFGQNVFPSTGNVGIGTTNPQGKLDVAQTFVTAPGTIQVRPQDGTFEGGEIDLLGAASNSTWSIDNYAGRLRLFTYASTTSLGPKVEIFNCTTGNAGLYVQGDVGIGTSLPLSKLHITADTSNSGSEANSHGLAISSGTNGRTIWMGYDSVADIGYINAAKYGSFQPVVLQSRGGNVGIGTTNPLRKLHLYETNGYTELLLESTFTPTSNGRLWGLMTDPTNGSLVIRAANSNITTSNGVMSLLPSGNVGIGTNNPLSKLTVQTTADYDGILATNGSKRIQLLPGTTHLGTFNPITQEGDTAIIYGANLGAGIASALVIAPWSSSLSGLRIDQSGNVGIGTPNPTNKLEVNGTIRAKEVIVETTGWSDYVFAPNYRLAPLSEVEAHIASNGTLPGIPSAAEVAEKGVSVGDMQAKLLAKVEEMTLHMIALSKKVDSQTAEIAALKAENAALKLK